MRSLGPWLTLLCGLAIVFDVVMICQCSHAHPLVTDTAYPAR